MIVCFDIHGVLKPNKTVDNMEVIEEMRRCLKIYFESGFTVYVMSGSTERRGKNELIELGLFQYVHGVFSVTDYRYAQDPHQVIWKNHHPFIEDKKVWDSTKAEMCEKLDVDILIDDCLHYRDYIKSESKLKFLHVTNDCLK